MAKMANFVALKSQPFAAGITVIACWLPPFLNDLID